MSIVQEPHRDTKLHFETLDAVPSHLQGYFENAVSQAFVFYNGGVPAKEGKHIVDFYVGKVPNGFQLLAADLDRMLEIPYSLEIRYDLVEHYWKQWVDDKLVHVPNHANSNEEIEYLHDILNRIRTEKAIIRVNIYPIDVNTEHVNILKYFSFFRDSARIMNRTF